MGKVLSYWEARDTLEILIRAAAWEAEGKKANGSLHEATFYWPAPIKLRLSKIRRCVESTQWRLCSCAKKTRKKRECPEAHAKAAALVCNLKITPSYKKKVIKALSRIPHTRCHDDRSSE